MAWVDTGSDLIHARLRLCASSDGLHAARGKCGGVLRIGGVVELSHLCGDATKAIPDAGERIECFVKLVYDLHELFALSFELGAGGIVGGQSGKGGINLLAVWPVRCRARLDAAQSCFQELR